MLYLVLPQTQGAKLLWLDYLEPFIVHHESQIDNLINEVHAKLQQFGLGYVNNIVEIIRERVLGQKSPQPPPQGAGAGAAGSNYGSYAADLLSRFAMPQARQETASTLASGGAGGAFGALSSFATSYMAGPGQRRDVAAEAASIPDSLPRDMSSVSSHEKASAIAGQKERLTNILRQLESEQQSIDLAYGTTGQRPPSSGSTGLRAKNRSEQSFENINDDEPSDYNAQKRSPRQSGGGQRQSSGSWVPAGVTSWLGGGQQPHGQSQHWDGRDERSTSGGGKGWSAARDMTDAINEGMSSGYDRSR